jgi:predicted NUDIX family NTP pyrophosphohydrolase
MPKRSAGILLYRKGDSGVEVLLVHPGGPLWAHKDDGAWSIPKGQLIPGEDPLTGARRELLEETGLAPLGPFAALPPVKQDGGKEVLAWAVAFDCDASAICSNTFTMEWPPHSGATREFPEVDRAAWFTLEQARRAINKGQRLLLEHVPETQERE